MMLHYISWHIGAYHVMPDLYMIYAIMLMWLILLKIIKCGQRIKPKLKVNYILGI